jgi:uncharacterized protein YndB with AHSA1/START domain
MGKLKYIVEYEIRASVKMVFPYLSTPNGLAEWFAEKVKVMNDNKTYDIVWDGVGHPARIVAQRTNAYVKYQFLPETPEDEEDPSYLEFKLNHNEMTDTTFLKIIDYSEITNENDLRELWNNLIATLRERIGG